jgi:tellurite resistance protein TerC
MIENAPAQPDSGTTLRARTVRQVKRIMIAIVGGTVLLFGIVLIVLPGPAILVIPAGLGILAIEFAWARRWLERVRALTRRRKS